jgi:tRNA(fMet)-specific endonuclease VapC
MRYVLDTTAFSAAMRHDQSLLKLLKKNRPGDIVTVPPVVAEIQYGIERLDSSSKKYLLLKIERDRLLSIITVLPWSSESSGYFGKIKANLERRGELIDDFDIAIASIAVAHKCGVITSNISHFLRVENLVSKSWQKR